MFDYEGSRSELLKLLAEFGEEPAFIARAGAPEIALEALIRQCETMRAELLKWPKFHWSALAQRVGRDWPRLGSLLATAKDVALLADLHAQLQVSESDAAQVSWLWSDQTALRRFLESAARFNRNWQTYLDRLDLEATNKPRREFNQFYVLEKACAFGNDQVAEGFEPLEMIDKAHLLSRFPLLTIPKPA